MSQSIKTDKKESKKMRMREKEMDYFEENFQT